MKPAVLTTQWVLQQFAPAVRQAQNRYREFVHQGRGVASPWSALTGQVLLGGQRFIEKLAPALREQSRSPEVPKRPRLVHRPSLDRLLSTAQRSKMKRDAAICEAFIKHGYTLKEIGSHLGLHYTTISKITRTGH